MTNDGARNCAFFKRMVSGGRRRQWLSMKSDYSTITRKQFSLSYDITYESPHNRNRDSAVGIATSYGLEEREIEVQVTVGQAFSLHVVRSGSGVHPAFYPVCTGGSFPGVKQPGREANHSAPSSAKLKNGGSEPSLPHTSL
jgi:hypothetical protein